MSLPLTYSLFTGNYIDCYFITFRYVYYQDMMTSSNENLIRVTGLLCEEFTVHRWIPFTKASDAELWCFLWSAPRINGWVNKHEAGDLRRHDDHYDITVMKCKDWVAVGINAEILAIKLHINNSSRPWPKWECKMHVWSKQTWEKRELQ